MRDFLYQLFFPHPLNNHRARILHHKTLLFIIGIFIFSSFFFPSSLNPIRNKIKAFAQVTTTELFKLTNEKRVENGLFPLSQNVKLEVAAEKKAEDMIAKDYWAHNSPDGTTPWVFIRQAGYNYVYAGENLARGFNSATDVVAAWMASEEHRKNILSPNFTDVGFAVKEGELNGTDTFLVVEELGSENTINPQIMGTTPKRFSASIALPSLSRSSQIILLMMFSLIALLIIDSIIIHRKKIVRFTGHNLDHALFLFTMAFLIILFNSGVII